MNGHLCFMATHKPAVVFVGFYKQYFSQYLFFLIRCMCMYGHVHMGADGHGIQEKRSVPLELKAVVNQ